MFNSETRGKVINADKTRDKVMSAVDETLFSFLYTKGAS